MTFSMDQFKETYITECFELLAEMEEKLLALNPETADKEQLNAIFRCAHSIKGGSGAFGLIYITNFTHVLEALLDSLRDGKILPTQEVVDTLLKAADIVKQMVVCAQENRTPDPNMGTSVLDKLKNFSNLEISEVKSTKKDDQSNKVSENKIYLIKFEPNESLFSTGNDPLLVIRELKKIGDIKVLAHTENVPPILKLSPSLCYLSWDIEINTDREESQVKEAFEFVEDHCKLSIIEKKPEETQKNKDLLIEKLNIPQQAEAQSSKPGAASSSIRVDLIKIDRLVNMVGELVITEAMLKAQTKDFPVDKFSGLIRGIEELSQHARELQEAVMSVRMQPVKSIFSRMPRIVHDLSLQLGKNIKLVTFGENTEVDKTVIEQLSDPLTHMIRNSVDHGIESPNTRKDKGKTEQGTIKLSADHRGGRIIIEIEDDGGGINREKVLKKAKEKGLVSEDTILTNEECDNLIFHAGFSTAETVSNISGRGVGMDVVKRNIEGMGGSVKVTNNPGKGSIFTVSLPLTLAILDGMIVRVGTENYIIPITSIIETLRPNLSEVHRVEGHSDVINVRGEFISLMHLHEIFKIPDAQHDPSKALVVLVESGKEKMGLVVDELIGQQQVVIKSLSANADPVKGISGATILGDGRVSLILEINELWQVHRSGHGLERVHEKRKAIA